MVMCIISSNIRDMEVAVPYLMLKGVKEKYFLTIKEETGPNTIMLIGKYNNIMPIIVWLYLNLSFQGLTDIIASAYGILLVRLMAITTIKSVSIGKE